MKRWLYVWWVPLLGLALATGSAMGGAALADAHRGLASVPCWVTMVVSFGVAFVDILPESWGYDRRLALAKRPCEGCAAIDRRLVAVTKDRNELREALATLALPADPRRL